MINQSSRELKQLETLWVQVAHGRASSSSSSKKRVPSAVALPGAAAGIWDQINCSKKQIIYEEKNNGRKKSVNNLKKAYFCINFPVCTVKNFLGCGCLGIRIHHRWGMVIEIWDWPHWKIGGFKPPASHKTSGHPHQKCPWPISIFPHHMTLAAHTQIPQKHRSSTPLVCCFNPMMHVTCRESSQLKPLSPSFNGFTTVS